jgi:hypothetical protein
MTTACLRAATAACVLLFLAWPARGGGVADDLWAVPDGAAAWWIADPNTVVAGAAPDPLRALAESGLRCLIARTVPVEGGAGGIGALLSPGVLGRSPYRVCLMEIEAEPVPGKPGPDQAARLKRVAAVLEVRRAGPHDSLVESVRAGPAAGLEERSIDLPGGVKGVAARTAKGDACAEVSWCSVPGSFLVGFGEGALARWFEASPMGDKAEPVIARDHIAKRRTDSGQTFEAGVDLNALRRAMPEQFVFGRIGRLAEAWHLSNARIVMVSARTMPVAEGGPRLLAVDVAWSARSEVPGTVHSAAVTEGAWPADLGVASPAPYVAVLRSDWDEWVGLALETWKALSPKGGVEVNAAQQRWLRKHRAALDRLAAQSGRWIVLRSGAEGVAVDASLQLSGKPERFEGDLREVFGTLDDAVHLDTASHIWSLVLREDQADPDHVLRRFFWRVNADSTRLTGAWTDAPLRLTVEEPAKRP